MELTFRRSLCRSLIPSEILHSDIELASESSAKSIYETPCKSCAHCKQQRSITKSTKPAIKSIILNASSQPLDSQPLKKLNIKQEPANDENEMSDINVPKSLRRSEKLCKKTASSENVRKAASSFTPPRDSNQLKTKKMLGKSATVVDYRQSPRNRYHTNSRSHQKSPSRRHSSRRKSKSANRSTRSRSSDSDRYSRHSSSRESTPRRSRSHRSVSRRSGSRDSKSRSRSRHSRDTRSYGSTTSTSSSDSDRRSNSRYRSEHSRHRSKSPSAGDRKTFNYQNSIMTTSQRSNGRSEKSASIPLKRFAGANHGPETSKKYVIKPQPVVKLHSEPGTDSDDDGKIEREYEELLTFETNEDERREQRLLKALSDIAAKAKQKIQSITNESNVVSVPTMVNNMQHDVYPKTTHAKPFRNNVWLASNDKSNERRSTSYHNDDHSPKSKHPPRRSRKDDDGTIKITKTP